MDHDNTNSDKKSLMSCVGKIFGANHLFHGIVKTLLKTHLEFLKFLKRCVSIVHLYICTLSPN